MTDPTATCPDRETLAKLLDGELDEAISDSLMAHVKDCEACGAACEAVAAEWSLGHLADTPPAAGDETLDLRQRLAAAAPELTAAGSDSAALPRGTPIIPGIVDLEPIGRGGMGMVYRGRDVSLDRLVAVKVLFAVAPLSDAARSRAEREALMLARLDHQNVVAIFSAGETGGTPYLVMEWVPGPSLQKRLAAGLPTPRQAARIGRDLARALEQVHALGIIHRDIKPDNILTAGDADNWTDLTPKLADFGLARAEAATSIQLTQADTVLGTPAYMAPEQTGLDPDLGEVGPPSDIHGLGGVLFAMLTGHAPYEAKTVTASLQRATRGELLHATGFGRLPADLRTITEKCLHREPARRYRSAGELADDLTRFLDGLPVTARPISTLERAAKWARRRPVAALALALSVAFVIAGIGGTAYHVVELERANDQISRSRDRAEEAVAVAERSMQRLSSAAIKRMLLRGDALDGGDQEFLRQVREEYRRWPLGSDPVKALWFRLGGVRQVAGMFFDVGQYADALASQQAELEILDELAARLPGDTQVLRNRLDAHYRMRFSLYHLRQTDEAVASARESIRLLESAPADLPRRQRDLAGTRMYLAAFLYEQGRPGEGLAEMLAADRVFDSLRAQTPGDISLAHQQADFYYTAQLCAFNAGQQADRQRWLDQLVAVAGADVEQFPAAPETVRDRSSLVKLLGIGLGQQSNLAREAGRSDEALKLLERRRQTCRRFLANLPANQIDPVHRELIDADIDVAKLLLGLGRNDEAEPVLAEARGLADRLATEQPAVWDHARLLARVLWLQAEAAEAAGDPAAAAALLTRQLSLLEPWLAHEGRSNDATVFIEAAREMQARLTATKALAAD